MKVSDFTSKIFSQKIAIIGDFLVDEYIYGHTSKIAREAPVIVTKYSKSEKRIGGAGNAVKNAVAWGGTVVPIGFVGDDENGKFIIKELQHSGVSTDNIVVVNGRNTPTKTRVMSGIKRGSYQQVLRMDRQDDTPYMFEYQKQLAENLNSVLEFIKPDLILVSDYGLSTITGQITYELSNTKLVVDHPLFIDSHNIKSFQKSKGVIVNMEEALAAVNTKEPSMPWETRELCRKLIEKFDTECVLLTRGKEGVVLLEKQTSDVGELISIPADARFSPVDITGAGDTVAVAFARSLIASENAELAAKIANTSAGISVSQPGASVADIRKVIDCVGLERP
jgi:rfaE bifunctional protein kinase chain/domain